MNKEQWQLCTKALDESIFRNNYELANRTAFDTGFMTGFESAFDLQQKKLDAYAAYVNGSITRAQLDRVLNDE